MKNKRLAFKLSFYILTVSIMLFICLMLYNYQISKDLIFDETGQTAQQLSNATVSEIEKVIEAAQLIPSSLKYVIENSELSLEEIKNIVGPIVNNSPEIYGCCIAYEPYSFYNDKEYFAPYIFKGESGIEYKDLDDENYDYFTWEWYLLPKGLNEPIWSEPYFDDGGGDIVMSTYSLPFYSQNSLNKEFKGVITADLSLKWLEELIGSIKVYESGYAFLVSESGTFISHPNTDWQLNESVMSIAEKYNRPDLINLVSRLKYSDDQFVSFMSLVNEKESLIYYREIKENNWAMCLVIPKDELFADLDNLFLDNVIIGLFFMLLLLFLIILISREITMPLTELVEKTELIGAGNFDVEIPVSDSVREISILSYTLISMQGEIREYIKNLEETTAAKNKIESELKIAHDIQQGMIPKIFPPFPKRDDVDVFAILNPARQVGGDLYDFFFLDENLLCVTIGDVSDKGVPASLLMAITITLVRSKADKNQNADEIVNNINKIISENNENMMFVTFFLGLIDLKTGIMNYCNAGHNYPYIISGDEVVEISQTHGPPLGIIESKVYKSDNINVGKNDKLILFTDGVTEAMDINENLYEDERLRDLISNKCKNSTPKEITNIIYDDVMTFADGADQADDISILVMSYY